MAFSQLHNSRHYARLTAQALHDANDQMPQRFDGGFRGMVFRKFRTITSLVLLGVGTQLAAQSVQYWDPSNGSGAGTGTTTPSGSWNTVNSNKVWNSDPGGTFGTAKWVEGNDVVFSAGTDATGNYTVTVSTVTANSITVEEGNPTFSSGTITLNTPSFTVATGSTATMNSDLAGTVGLTKLGGGTLVLGTNDKSYSGTTTVTAGTLNLAFNQTFDTMNLAGGTLSLSSISNSITNLNVTVSSVIDFGGANATFNVTNLSISAGVTLNIKNWTNAADFFYVQNWSGATLDAFGSAPMNQVVFTDITGSNARWQSIDKQITVPEPGTYGAILLAALSGLGAWRRMRHARGNAGKR